MKPTNAILFYLCSLLWTGCIGVRFKDVAVNQNLPKDLTNRNLYSDTSIFKYDLAELAGSLLYKYPDETEFRRVGRLLKEGYQPKVRMSDMKVLYHSKVSKGGELKGEYLAFAAGLTNDQVADIKIQDSALVLVPESDIPKDKLAKEKAKKPEKAGVKRFYVQGVLLGTITIQNYNKTSSHASGAIGDHVGVMGNVYRESDEFTEDYTIALELIDIDEVGGIGALDLAKVQGLKIQRIVDKKD